MNWYLKVLEKYAVFDGRARRKEYWYFVLFNSLFYLAFVLIDKAVGFGDLIMDRRGPLSLLYTLAVLLPEIAVTARRLHDTNHSGWWQLIFVPILTALLTAHWLLPNDHGKWLLMILFVVTLLAILVLLLWLVRDSDAGENRWGPNPKKEPVAAKTLSDTA